MSKTYTVAKHPAATSARKPRELSRAAQAAKMIRQTLKTAFPTVTFSVKSSSFAGGDAVDISWTDGPTTQQVERLVNQHETMSHSYDSDCWVASNVRHDIPQASYVQTQRTESDDALRAMVAYMNRYWAHEGCALALVDDGTYVHIDRASDAQNTMGRWWSNEVRYNLCHTSMICDACNAHTLPGDRFCPMCGQSLTKEDAAA